MCIFYIEMVPWHHNLSKYNGKAMSVQAPGDEDFQNF